jgi:hypothetical protein
MEKIKINTNEIISEVQLDGKKIHYDGDYIVGYVPQTAGIKKWDTLLLKTDNTERPIPCKSNVENVIRTGYFEITEYYPLQIISGYTMIEGGETLSAYCYDISDKEDIHDPSNYKFDPYDNIITSEIGDAEVVTYSSNTEMSVSYKKYIKYNNGKYYYSDLLSSATEDVDELIIDGITYPIDENSEISVTERYFIENDKVVYDGKEYDVDKVLMEVEELKDKGFNAFNYIKFDEPKYLTKVTIYGAENTEFTYDVLTNGTATPTLDYKGKTYEVHMLQDYLKNESEHFMDKYVMIENGDIDGTRSIYFNDFPSIEVSEYYNEIDISGVTYPIDSSYHAYGNDYDVLLIYTRSKECYDGDFVIAKQEGGQRYRLYVDYFGDDITSDGYIEYLGNRFSVSSSSDTVPFISLNATPIFEEDEYGNQILVENVYYEIENISINGNVFNGVVNADGYILHVSGNTSSLEYNNPNATCTLMPTSQAYGEFSSLTDSAIFNIVNKRYVYIFDEKYYVNDVEVASATFSSVTINGAIDIDREDDILLEVVDVDGYRVACTLPSFYPSLTTDIDGWDANASIVKYIIDNQDSFTFFKTNPIFGFNTPYATLYEANDDTIREEHVTVYKSNNSVILPIYLRNKNANNIDQDLVLQRDFVDKEIDRKINDIVDMEKDIYYPSICIDDSTCDYKFIDVNEIDFNIHLRTRDNEWKIDDNAEYGWNIFDKYDSSYGTVDNISVDSVSDLLDFLGFDNNDVFYQKSKIGKSFLRLRVYDSIDPFRQTLLATSTVFMNEGKLFKRYINGQTLIDKKYSPYNHYGSIYTKNTTKTEEIDDNDDIIFNSDLRLDSKFIINNRYECEESAEGFYYYIFKDIANLLHEKTVYLKVDFNHAGVGKRIPLIFSPMKKDGDDTILDIDSLVNGFTIDEFINERAYLPMEIKYDKEAMRYRYYFRNCNYVNDKDNSKIVINLWENKFKDD